MSETMTIGCLGFGAMASRMAANLRQAGHRITAWTPSGRAHDGVTMEGTARALAQTADVVLACVPDDRALWSALDGEDGLLSGLKPGQLLINASTTSPATADRLAETAKTAGFAFLDCPVSGSTPEAEAGTLVILAGGTEDVLARARPLLETIGKTIIHAGPAGMGTRLKMVINGIMGAGTAALSEGISYGLLAGVEREVLFDALGQVAVISPHHKRKLEMGRKGEFPSQFPTRLMAKDMGLLIDDARRVGAFLPGLAVTAQSYALLTRRHADDDYAALIGAMERSVVNTP